MEQSHADALVNEIIGDAEKKAVRTLRRGDREAGQIVEKAEKQAESIRRAATEAAQMRAEKEKTVVLATVDLDARRIEMAAEERLIVAAFDSAQQKMLDKQAYGYPAVVARLIAEAAQAIGGDSFRVELSNDDRKSLDFTALTGSVCERLGRQVELSLADEPAPIAAGAIVRSPDGRRMVDDSLEARLVRMRDELRRRVAQVLFGGTET